MLGAIYSGIYQYTQKFDMPFTCSTGNCTWETPFTTLAICSSCFDITSSLNKSSCGTERMTSSASSSGFEEVAYCNYTLPNGLSLDGNPSHDMTFITLSGNRSDSVFARDASTLSVMSAIQAEWLSLDNPNVSGFKPNPRATECHLNYCLQKLNTTVTKGVIEEDVVDTYRTIVVSDYVDDNSVNYVPPKTFTGAAQSPDPQTDYYQGSAILAMRKWFAAFWHGSLTYAHDTRVIGSDIASMTERLTITEFQHMFGSIAKSMTIAVRTIPRESNEDPRAATESQALQDVPHVHVRWAWIALPAILVVLAFILLVSTAIDTEREGALLWKGSSLAPFCHPLARDARDAVVDITSPREMLKVAEKLPVKFEKIDDGGYRLAPPPRTNTV
jgi:hypothetical protein